MKLRRVGLRTELVIAFALVALLAVGINTLVVWGLARLLINQERGRLAAVSAEAAALRLSEEDDPDALVARAESIPGVARVAVFDHQGHVVASHGQGSSDTDAFVLQAIHESKPHTGAPQRGDSGALSVTIARPYQEGAIRLVFTVRGDPSAARRFRSLSFIYVGLNALVIAVFGLWLISRSVIRPVRTLSDASVRVASGDLSSRVPVAGSGEVAQLARSFNGMIEALQDRESRIARQILELKRANERLQTTQEELIATEKLAGVGRLAAGVAHEMGNPLGAITGYVSMLLKSEEIDEEQRRTLEGIEREAGRLDRIIRDLLDYARPREEGASELEVNEVVRSATSMLGGQRAFRAVKVELDLADGLDTVWMDEHRLQQVLVNLLINAADAMDGAGRIRIATRMGQFPEAPPARRRDDAPRPEGSAVEIVVSDEGPGIAEDEISRLFEPFFTTKSPGKGTGLGLAITQRIVDAAGGRISASNTDHGAAFTVQLPPGKR